MQITSRFTIAVHIITAVAYLKDHQPVTSRILAGSVGADPVIIRTVMGKLKAAGILSVRQGRSGIELGRPLEEITFYDVYRAVGCVSEAGLFHFHEAPGTDCPVGRVIHTVMDDRLTEIQASMERAMDQIVLSDVVADARRAIEGGSSDAPDTMSDGGSSDAPDTASDGGERGPIPDGDPPDPPKG